MKAIAWLAGLTTIVIAAAYMIVSLNRWEWNRALFAAVAVGIIGLIVAVILPRDATLSTHEPVDPDSRIELIIKVSPRDGE